MFLQVDIENENQLTLLVGNFKKPTRGIQLLQNLHGQILGCHLLILFLKELILLSSFSLSGVKFHILGQRFDMLSEI